MGFSLLYSCCWNVLFKLGMADVYYYAAFWMVVSQATYS